MQRHIETLLHAGEWEALIADDIMWELPFAPCWGTRGSYRGEGGRRPRELVPAVEGFRFYDIQTYGMADPNGAAGEVRAEGTIKSTGRTYREEYVFSCGQ